MNSKKSTLGKLLKSDWESDANPQSAPKSFGLTVINPQAIPRIALLAVSITNIAFLLNGGFFYIDTSNRLNFGSCFSRGDLFSHCINEVVITLVSAMAACIFILKDFVVCSVNSLSWIRWMQVVEGATFFILSAWWAISATLYFLTAEHAKSVGTPAVSGNSSVPAPDLSLDVMAALGTEIISALSFSLLGLSIVCLVSNGLWLIFYSFT